jgi:magnesium chelatase subunit I
MDKLTAVQVNAKAGPEMQVSAAEFLLEGLHAHKRIGRSEERVFKAEKPAKRVEKTFDPEGEEFPPSPRSRRPYN